MKNQNDLIFSIVAGVIGIGCALGFFFTKREPVQPTPPTTVVVTDVALPTPAPAMANGLSGGSGAAGGFPGGGFPGGGMRGGPPSGLGAPGGPSGAMGGGGMPGGRPRPGVSSS